MKNASASAPSGNTAFAGVVMASEMPHEVQHGSDDDDMPPAHATAYLIEETCYMVNHHLQYPSMQSETHKWGVSG